jgi:UDP-MurNAc hydroxylase
MKVTWYTNACVRITSDDGANILCDPWVNGGAFLGSWFHWPPIPDDLEAQLIVDKCDGVYISHLHPDHYDPKFLAKFSRANPDTPIYIAEFAHPWLKRSIKAVVSNQEKVIDLPINREVQVAPGFTLKVFAADTCNPSICGASVSCQIEPSMRGIDSIGVFSADGRVVVNANDAMGIHLVSRIAGHIGKADLLMGHYGGASPYPQCFPDVEDKAKAGRQVIKNACETLLTAADALDAQFVMPFAGQYMLGGSLHVLNSDRATLPLDQAVSYLQKITSREVISVNPFGEIDLSSGNKTSDYVEPSQQISTDYQLELSHMRFSYEKEDPQPWIRSSTDLEIAAESISQRSKFSKISFSNSFVIGDGDKWITINLDSANLQTTFTLGRDPKFEDVTEILMHPELLRRLSTRKRGYKGFTTMHWNQADVGSHFQWKRSGRFDLQSHSLLNFYGV